MISSTDFYQIEKETRDAVSSAILNHFRSKNGSDIDCCLPPGMAVYVSGRLSKGEIAGSVILNGKLIEPVSIAKTSEKTKDEIVEFFRIFGESLAFKHGITYDDLQ